MKKAFFILVIFFLVNLAKAQYTFNCSDTIACAPFNITCTPQVDNLVKYYYWYATNGTSDTSKVFNTVFNKSGEIHTIYLYLYDSNYKLIGQLSKQIQVKGISKFIWVSDYTVCPNETIQFGYYSSFSSVSWQFFDEIRTGQFVSKAFADTGIYNVKCFVTSECGLDSIEDQVVVKNNIIPNANFSKSAVSYCPGSSINFNCINSIASEYIWDFGDGEQDTTYVNSINHVFNSPGDYNVSLRVTNKCGNSNLSSILVTIGSSSGFDPNLYYSATPSISCPNQLIEFNSEFGFSKYEFDFGDNSDNLISNSGYVVHAFEDTGLYQVSIKFTDYCGFDTVVFLPVNVVNDARITNPYVGDIVSCPGKEELVSASKEGVNYVWNFNGDTIVTSNSYCYKTINDTGSYVFSVKITNGCGVDTSVFFNWQVKNDIYFNTSLPLTISPLTVCPNTSVRFSSNLSYKTYEWDFGDSTSITTGPPNSLYHYYKSTGVYNVKLKVTNHCGFDTLLSKNLIVVSNKALPSNMRIEGEDVYCPGDISYFNVLGGSGVYFSNFSSGVWDFGDGSPLDSNTTLYSDHEYKQPGNYQLSVRVYNNCGNDTILYKTVIIQDRPFSLYPENKLKIISEYGGSTFCPGDKIQLTGPAGFARYFWNKGDGVFIEGSEYQEIIIDSIGNTEVQLKIENGCGYDTTISYLINISNFAPLNSINLTGTFIVCPGEYNRFSSFPAGLKKYEWDFGDGQTATTTSNYYFKSYDTSGVYNVRVKGYNSCNNSTEYSRDFNVAEDNQLKFLYVTTSSEKACVGDEVLFEVASGLSNYQYHWDFGDGQTSITVGQSITHAYQDTGTYNASMIAYNSCGFSRSYSFQIIVTPTSTPQLRPNSFGFYSETKSNLAGCSGDAVAFYFEGMFENEWDFGDGTVVSANEIYYNSIGVPVTIARHSYNNPGIYYAKLTKFDKCGNWYKDSVKVVISNSSSVQGFLIAQAPLSNDGYNICAPISYLAGGGKTYSWDFGDGVQDVTTTPANSHLYSSPGNYNIKVNVTNSCGISKDYYYTSLVKPGPVFSSSFNIIKQPTCAVSNNGELEVNIIGGKQPYIYEWNNNNISTSTNFINNVSPGIQTLKVTDANNCVFLDTILLETSSNLSLSLAFQQVSSCSSPTGAAMVQTFGGIAPFTYSWSNGSNGQLANNLQVGTYSVSVTDSNSCVSSITVTINSSNGASVNSVLINKPSCYGLSNGSVNISVNDGTAPYQYSWSNGSLSANLNNVPSGYYTLNITDAAGCKTLNQFYIDQPQAFSGIFNNVNADCSKFNGSSQANISGGTPPYSYLWSEGSTTNIQTGLPIGDYTLRVTDSQGCSSILQTSIGNNNAPNVDLIKQDVKCYGQSNGSIALNISGGTSPYLKTWFHNGSHAGSVSNLSPGLYTVSVLDASGCQVYKQIQVNQPNQLVGSLSAQDVNCGLFNGSISSNVQGGTLPYSYSWSNGFTSPSINNLSSGNYQLIVLDANLCSLSLSESLQLVLNTQPICLVSVDETSMHNQIVWEHPTTGINGIKQYKVYRSAASTYVLVDSISSLSSTIYTDLTPGINPNSTQYRYKLTVIDSCGNESIKSLYHQTIWLQEPVYNFTNNSMLLNWANYEIENTPLDTNYYYRIELDTIGNGSFFGVDSVGNGILQKEVFNLPNADTLIFRVIIIVPQGCDPSRARIATSRSNIKNTSRITRLNYLNKIDITVKPNPVQNSFYISGDFVYGKEITIKMFDMNGRLIYNKWIDGKSRLNENIDMKNFVNGLYQLQLSGVDFLINKKIVKTN